ncbi:MAG: PAS domain-containing protein [Chroococcidiopsidaceae cyanobacterium CP_BM_ER_R8_30]|nr:PAS domain-containing protein [Chroococcidiopsidaceae cyanobacterium CP_BM_ER_R8_30]
MADGNWEEFYQRTQATRIRAAELCQHTRSLLMQQQDLLVTACEELYNALDNLEAAEEELHQKNEELTAAYEIAELKRQYYHGVFEYTSDAYLVTDTVGVIRQANRIAAKLLNLKQPFLVGKPLVAFFDKKDRPTFRSKLSQLHRLDQVQETWEVNLLPRKSEPLDVAVTMNVIRNQLDVPVALCWVVRDIRKRKQAQTALRLLCAGLQANEPIVITSGKLDEPGPEITFVNQAFTQMTGYTMQEIVGKSPRILQGDKTDRLVLARLRHNLLQGQLFHGELINYRKDNTEYHVEVWCIPISDNNGKVANFISRQRNITPTPGSGYLDSAQSPSANP